MDDSTQTQQVPPAQTQAAAPPQPLVQTQATASGNNSGQVVPSSPQAGTQPPQPVPIKPGTPHAGLLNMIQSLALGVDAFATSAATHGREGGVEEVQQVHAQQQQQQIQAQQAQQEQQEHDLRMKVQNAQLNMAQAQFEHSQRMWPTEEKAAMLGYRDELAKAIQDAPQWAGSSTEEMEAFLGSGAGGTPNPAAGTMASQPGVITVPFSAGQDQATVLKNVQAAVPPGKSATGDYVSVVSGGHGKDGSVTLIPSDNPILDRPAPSPLIRTFRNSVDLAEKQGEAAGVTDDPRFKAASAQADTIAKQIDAGAVPTYRQMQQLYFSVIPMMTSVVSNKIASDKTAKDVAETQGAIQASDVVSQLSKPGELGKPDAAQTIQVKIIDPATKPQDVPRLTALLSLVPQAQSAALREKTRELQAQQSVTQGDPAAAGRLLAEHVVTIPDLKTRGATPQWMERAVSAAQKIDPSFKAPEMEGFARVAGTPAVQQFFGNTDSLLVKGGTLDQVATAARALPTGRIPVFNTVANAAQAATGGGPVAAYAAAVLGVGDDYAKVMQGSVGSDTARQQVLDRLKAAQSPEQINDVLNQFRQQVRSQRNGRIGINPYLKDMYPDPVGVDSAGVSVTAPDGSVHLFPTQQAANQFKQAAGIK